VNAEPRAGQRILARVAFGKEFKGQRWAPTIRCGSRGVWHISGVSFSLNGRFAPKAVVRESQFLTGLYANLGFLNSGPVHGRFRCTLYAYKLGTRVSTSEKCPKLVLVSTGRRDTWIRDFVEVCLTPAI
jgi:hypothetical protein